MEIILTIAYTLLFIFLIGKMRFFHLNEVPLGMIKAGFLIKVVAGIMVGLVYTFYYTDRLTADTFKFFDDSRVLFDAALNKPFDFIRMVTGIDSNAEELTPYYNQMNNWYDVFSPFNDNRTMIRFNTLIRFLSMGYYNVHVVFICFLSLTGIVAIVKVLNEEFPFLAIEFFLVFLLLPSVLFWGSGLLKDALVYFSFGMVLFLFNKICKTRTISYSLLITFLLALYFLMLTKFQMFLLLLPLLAAWFMSKKWNVSPLLAFSLMLLATLVVLLSPLKLIHQFDLPALLASKQSAFINLATSVNAGSLIDIPILEPNALSLLTNAPIGFILALTRPFITDSGPVLTLISGIENTLILTFCVFCGFKFNRASISGKVIPWFCLFYVITYFSLIGMVTPVLGAIVRYKAQALPFLVIMFVIISSSQNISIIRKLFLKNRNY